MMNIQIIYKKNNCVYKTHKKPATKLIGRVFCFNLED